MTTTSSPGSNGTPNWKRRTAAGSVGGKLPTYAFASRNEKFDCVCHTVGNARSFSFDDTGPGPVTTATFVPARSGEPFSVTNPGVRIVDGHAPIQNAGTRVATATAPAAPRR